MDGRLSNPEICLANLRSLKNPWMDFLGPYARLEGWRSQTAARRAGAVAEPWKAGDDRHEGRI